jgi:lipopolysaccharide/colanic/teichoic acid biosynthesis glycosyltransferase
MENGELYHRLQQSLKRALDITLSAIGLILLLPMMVVIALAIRLDSPGPVLFRHRRVGRNGRLFDLLKFRTMYYGGDDSGYMEYLRQLIESEQDGGGRGLPYNKMDNDVRVTRTGKVLRRYYLDELPQLWNILKGEMSLVGPRPHVQFEVDHYRPEQQRRLLVKPGATGLWQVVGKSNCTFSELIELDLDYIDRWSLGFDLWIMMNTVWLMLPGGKVIWARTVKRIPGEERKNGEYATR